MAAYWRGPDPSGAATRLWGAMADRHRQRLLCEVTGELRLQRPADHGVGVESKDDRTREQPSVVQTEVMSPAHTTPGSGS